MRINIKLSGSKVMAAGIMLLGFCACKRETCDEPAPTLTFDTIFYQITPDADSLTLRTQFTDCQGDIGFENGTGGFDIETYLYEQINGQWILFEPDSGQNIAFFSKIPFSEKVNTDNKLVGTLEQKFGAVRQNSDTIRFETNILDRAGNKSNVVTTPTFVMPN
ncbi:MAG: hypothetical protein NWS74_11445 [Salibacteraceae bacterium]|nr:hypothetical protein [Salibacteraceae bacterium]